MSRSHVAMKCAAAGARRLDCPCFWFSGLQFVSSDCRRCVHGCDAVQAVRNATATLLGRTTVRVT